VSQFSDNNKRIAKNTLLLYIRMIFLMLISLYTSRVILNALGVQDFGLYNVVGGVVMLFSTISGTLSSAISRFITYELGKEDKGNLQNIFSTSLLIQIGLSVALLIIAETLGLWFVNHKMVIPTERINAVFWVYQMSVLTFCINLISVPYNALIIAHEKMSVFAYISIVEAVFKLVIVLTIKYFVYDKLILYSVLLMFVSLIIRYSYQSYCVRNFKEAVFRFNFDRQAFLNISSFAGWNIIGVSSAILRDQGGNVVLNLFAGPVVNAARGISMQVNNAVGSFANNFMTAVNPQITKSYAIGDYRYMMTLLSRSSLLSFCLLWVMSMPILFNTSFILKKWLVQVPEHAILFTQLSLVFILSESISTPLVTGMLATGKIKKYQILVGGVQLLNLPISYMLLKFGFYPETIIVVSIIISLICLFIRLFMLRNAISFKIDFFLNTVLSRIVLIVCITVLPAFSFSFLYSNKHDIKYFLTSTFLCLSSSLIAINFIGLTKGERIIIKNKIQSILCKRNIRRI